LLIKKKVWIGRSELLLDLESVTFMLDELATKERWI
jgi:hypothetical protein